MCKDPLEVTLDELKDQVLHDEVSRPDTEPGEADSTATGSESRELLSRGGSAPLQVDTDGDSEEEVTEVAAEVKTVEEKATLRTLFHRTPEGVGRVRMCVGSSSMSWSNCPSTCIRTSSGRHRGRRNWR